MPKHHSEAAHEGWETDVKGPAASDVAREIERSVCRSAYEKPTQAFLSWLDPRLRFLRDYEVIRPHAPHCLERIVLVDFDSLMEQALEDAELSRAEGNKGYGPSRILVGAAEIAERAPTALEVVGGVLKERCEALYSCGKAHGP